MPSVAGDATPGATTAGQDHFEIARPVKASDKVVKGTGLPGTAIELHDVTRMGVELGGTVVGDNGRFEIPVGALTANVRLGITLAEPDESIWANPALLGPQALVVPMVGSYLDTVLVEP